VYLYTACAVDGVRAAIAGLDIDSERMRANLDSTGGMFAAEALTTALAPKLGRHEAYRLVSAACDLATQAGRDLRSVVEDDETVEEVLGDGELDRVFDPTNYLGSSDAFVDAALSRWRREIDAVGGSQ
jgi:3-carboxy-cis,cis-muconate cycloisomerase